MDFRKINTLETLYGDVNLDGEIDITDCVLLNKCLAGAVELNKTAERNADVDQNNEIDTSDTIYLLQFLDSCDRHASGFKINQGNTAQRLCDRCVVKFFRQMKQKAE